jgi:hypothetical protein
LSWSFISCLLLFEQTQLRLFENQQWYLAKTGYLLVKGFAHRAGLPRKKISFLIVPLDPAYKAGFAGHLPVN